MARTTSSLTNTEVKQAKPRDKEYNLADGGGLYLRVKPSGTKLWLFNYFAPFMPKRSNLSLGRYPDLSLADAREIALTYRGLLAKDIDPKEHRSALEKTLTAAHAATFTATYDKWFKIKASSVSQAYADKIKQGFDNHLIPKLGKTPIHKLNAPEVIELIEPIAESGHLETVKKLCRWINELMTFAVNTGIIHANPLAGISKAFQSPRVRNMPTIKSKELPDFLQALSKAGITITTRSLIEWMLLTMTRPGEAAGAAWAEIDLKGAVWTIPERRMKGRKSHSIPLTPQALLILATMKPISEHREYVFPSSRSPRKPVSSQTANMALKRMGYKDRLVSHGIRALASTILNEQRFDPEIIEAALAHSDKDKIRAAYNRADYLEQRRVMMTWWSDYIERSRSGDASLEGSKHLRAVG